LSYGGVKGTGALVFEELVFFDFGAKQANLGKDAFDIEAEGLFGLAEFGAEGLPGLADLGAEGFLGVGDSAVRR
jgi:hypothetical protein